MDLEDLEAQVFRRQQAKAVRQAVDALSPRERAVIIARHGLDDAEPRTLDQTALELAKLDGYTVTRERIAQIERKAMRHLKACGGLHEVAGLKPPQTFNAAAFAIHQRARKAQREAAEQWLAQRAADERAARARRDADDFAAQQRARRGRRGAVGGPPPPGPPPPRGGARPTAGA